MDQQPTNTNSPTVVVTTKVKLTARDFFLWAGIILSLYVSVSALLTIIFTTLDKAFPDALDGSAYFFSSGSGIGMLSTPLSIVIILFPVFTLLTFLSNRALRKNPEREHLGFRKFAIWLTLFLSAALVITDLVVLVHYFLNGEITTRFLIKVIVIIIVAVIVGSYYIYDLRREAAVHKSTAAVFGLIAWIVVLMAIVYAFAVLGSPQNQRSLTLDMQRVQALTQVEQSVLSYWRDHGQMPMTLADLKTYGSPQDPEAVSGKMLEYNFQHDTNYEVCATFSTNLSKGDQNNYSYGYYGPDSFTVPGASGDAWEHGKGHVCFERMIDTERFAPNPRTVMPATVLPAN